MNRTWLHRSSAATLRCTSITVCSTSRARAPLLRSHVAPPQQRRHHALHVRYSVLSVARVGSIAASHLAVLANVRLPG